MIRCLDNVGATAREWEVAWERTGRQPFAHPGFVALFAQPEDEVMALVWHDSGGGLALLPLVRRKLPTDLSSDDASSGGPWTDAVSPYGFGGPFWSGNVDWRAFFGAVLEWMHDERVITFFLRASLELPTHSVDGLEGLTVRHISENVVVDLTRSEDDQWMHYEHKVRKNVKKAQRANLRVEIQTEFVNLKQFISIYQDTMRRRSADSWYLFEHTKLDRLGEQLRGSYVIAEVYDTTDQMVSTELVLQSEHQLYSFLGGTLDSAFQFAPNDLLKYAVINYGHAHAKAEYVLGGGYASGDGIFRYKKSFDVDGVRPFFGIQLVAESRAYERLVDTARMQVPKRVDLEILQSGYFPAYRALLDVKR